MPRANKKKSDGYFEASIGAAQIQIHSGIKSVGVIHSDVEPSANTPPHFLVENGAINYSYGAKKCYIIAMSDEDIDIGYMDIS